MFFQLHTGRNVLLTAAVLFQMNKEWTLQQSLGLIEDWHLVVNSLSTTVSTIVNGFAITSIQINQCFKIIAFLKPFKHCILLTIWQHIINTVKKNLPSPIYTIWLNVTKHVRIKHQNYIFLLIKSKISKSIYRTINIFDPKNGIHLLAKHT